jgi:phage terminase large subunit GpA-like protein
MGFVAPAEKVVARAIALALRPPPPPDITAWCARNVVFDARSPLPGPFDIRNFPFLKEIHEVLSPEHPAREVTVRKSAQIGGTVSLLLPTIAAWHEYGPVDSLVVMPTQNTSREFVQTKWMPMRRQAPSLREIFGTGRGDHTDSLFNQETRRRDGSLKVVSAGSPDDLATTTRRLVLMDEVSKYEMTPKGDPEQLAASRASAFEDAKIVRNSTPQIDGTCRVTKAYERGDQRLFHVPCPACDHYAPLTWDNFRRSIDPANLHAAHFTCDECGSVIAHKDKMAMLRRGRWVAQNPNGDHPSFHIWRAYSPTRDWASIAIEYARIMGWSSITAEHEDDAERQASRAHAEEETEQTFWNNVLGEPYKMAVRGPDWEKLRDRAENPPPPCPRPLPRGILPAAAFIFAAGVDCQEDRTEVQLVAFGPNFQRWVIENIVIQHHIRSDEARQSLDSLLGASFSTALGRKVKIDALAIDGGAYTDDVWEWAMKHPYSRVIVTKGSSSPSAPPMKRMAFDKKSDRKARRRQRQGWILGVSGLKGEFYSRLEITDPAQRGHVRFASGLGDEYYRQLTAEVREIKRSPSGVMISRWKVSEAGRRNEALDTMLMAEAAARFKDWHWMTPERWAEVEAQRATAPESAQGDLFATAAVASHHPPVPTAERPQEIEVAPPVDQGTQQQVGPRRSSFLGDKPKGWFRR